jgi:YD repeat-containing protein
MMKKLYSWDERQWLKSIEVRDSHKNIFYRKSFEYDRFGNPILEAFTGDLTGEGNQETFITKRTFSEDGRNLFLKEETEDGKVICFSYLPHTDLVTCKFTKNEDETILREFFIYDDCNNLIQTISDDGAGENKEDLSHVTQRRITTYILRQAAPFLHMPEWIEETYWEAGIEKPLKKTHLLYDGNGNIAREEVCDAEGRHVYTLCKTYNERGDVLTETNHLGQEAVYTYDTKGRPDTSTNFSHRLETKFHHDTKGRLCQQTEKGEDGIVHITSLGYDFHDRQIFKKDSFQNTTSYTYDPLMSKVVRTDFPPISIEGQSTSVATHSSLDPFGRELTPDLCHFLKF